MRRILKAGTLAGVALLAASCAIHNPDPKTEQNFAATVNSWQGADLDSLFKVWQYPDHIQKLPNGHKVFSYRVASWEPYTPYANSTSLTNVPQNASRAPRTAVVQSNVDDPNVGCTTWFEVDPKTQEIVSVRFQGNQCSVSQNFVIAKSFSTSNKDETL